MRILVDRFIYQGLRYAPSRHAVADLRYSALVASWGFASPRVWVRVHLLGAGGRRGPMNRLSMTIDALDAPWPFVAASKSAV